VKEVDLYSRETGIQGTKNCYLSKDRIGMPIPCESIEHVPLGRDTPSRDDPEPSFHRPGRDCSQNVTTITILSIMTFDFPSFLTRALSRSALLIAAVGLLLACSGGDQQPAEEKAGSTATASETDTTVVEMTMKDYAYEPADVTVPAGEPVTLKIKNTGTVEHYFVVGDTIASDGEGVRENLFRDVSLEKRKQTEGEHEEDDQGNGHEEEEHHENEFELPPGGQGSITFTLPESKAGTYTIACFETTGGNKHHELGMRGTLTVSDSN
jgi:uncharacterized cupredoxin-like copper-binding protein